MSWITIQTTALRWEAELMQQVLEAQDIPTRVIDLGVCSSGGDGQPGRATSAPSPSMGGITPIESH